MKIRVNGLVFDNIVIDNGKTLQIIVETENVAELSSNITKTNDIEVLDDNGIVISTVKGTFIQPQLVLDSSNKILEFMRKDESVDKWESLANPVSIMFVQMAQDGTLDDITISEYPDMFPEWDEKWTGKAGTILRDGDRLYRSIHDIGNIAQNTKPSETPSMWTLIADPTEEYPEWVQPIGAHDAYAINDKTSHNNKQWVSTVDNNIWEPGVYGWEEVV